MDNGPLITIKDSGQTLMYQDGWQVISLHHVHEGIRETVSRKSSTATTKGKEQDRLIDIMDDLLKGVTRVKWFFDEIHYRDGNIDQERIETEMRDMKFHTVYDSSWLTDLPDSGYNSIGVNMKMLDDGKCQSTVVLSCNGSMGASALSEYFQFTN